MKIAQRWMLTGERGAGKTSLCRSLAVQARAQGWDVAGVISPALFKNGQKTGILVEDLRSGKRHPLASLQARGSYNLPVGKWYFNRSGLSWGEQVIASSPPCDLLILDELGPLEFNQQGGWQAALQVLLGEDYQLALVVVRPELQQLAQQIVGFQATLTIDQFRSIDQWLQHFWPGIKEIFG